MTKRSPTTVNLAAQAQAIKEDLAPVYGLKNILSAGLLLFSQLTADEQKKLLKKIDDAEKVAREHHIAAARIAAKQRYSRTRPPKEAG